MSDLTLVVLFISICILISILSHELKRYAKIPVFFSLLSFGMILFKISEYTNEFNKIKLMVFKSDLGTLRFALIPILIFNSSYSSNPAGLKKQFIQIFILSISVFLSSAFLIAIAYQKIFNYECSFSSALVHGVIMSCTDNIFVSALFNEIRVPVKISNLVKGEAMIHYGIVFVLFHISLKEYSGLEGLEAGTIAFFRLTMGGIAIGLGFALVSSFIIRKILNDFVMETNLILACVYFIYWISEFNKFCGEIGIIVFGTFMAAYGKMIVSKEVESKMRKFIHLLSRNAESIILIISGMYLVQTLKNNKDVLKAKDFYHLFLIFLATYAVRAVVLLAHYPLLWCSGFKMGLREGVFICFAGIKGIISIVLAEIASKNPQSSEYERALVGYFGIGVTILSALFGGLAAKLSAKFLGLEGMTEIEENVLFKVIVSVNENTRTQIEKMKSLKDFHLADWLSVSKSVGYEKLFINTIKNYKRLRKIDRKDHGYTRKSLVYRSLALDEEVTIVEARKRYLSTLRGLYWKRHKKGLCKGYAAIFLSSSADVAINHSNQEMNDWEVLEKKIKIDLLSKVLKALSKAFCMGRVARKVLFEKMSTIYQCTVSFIRCHQETERLLAQIEYDSNDTAFSKIIKEARDQIKKSQNFMSLYIIDSYPDIISDLQTDICIKLIVGYQRGIIDQVFNEGLISNLEYEKLSSLNHSVLNTIYFDSSYSVPSFKKIIRNRFKSASEDEVNTFVEKTKIVELQPGEVVFREGTEVKGAFFILRGRVTEYSSWVYQELIVGQIVGCQNLIQEYSQKYISTAKTITACQLALISNEFAGFSGFTLDFFKEAAEEIVLFNRTRYGLLKAKQAHVLNLISPLRVKAFNKGDREKFCSGAFVLFGKVSSKGNWFVKPGNKKKDIFEDCIVLELPKGFEEVYDEEEGLCESLKKFYYRPSSEYYEAMSVWSEYKIKADRDKFSISRHPDITSEVDH